MEITYTCSEDDFVKATRLLLLKRQRRLLGFSVLCFFILLYALTQIVFSGPGRAAFAADSWNRKVIGFVLPLFICLSPLFVLYASRKNFRKNPVIAETRTLCFDEIGYTTQSASASGQLAWSVYDGFYEDKHSFLLMQKGSQIFVPIPKRELSQYQIDQLRSLFRHHLFAK